MLNAAVVLQAGFMDGHVVRFVVDADFLAYFDAIVELVLIENTGCTAPDSLRGIMRSVATRKR